jgi:arylsulfatase A-like enzyme/Flp pilus assembly protein TadD
MDSLAAQGIVFENAYSQVPITLPSHATILTGIYPYTHGIRHNGKFRLLPEATSLAEVLRDRGYHTAAFIGSYVLDAKYGLAQGFDMYDDEMPGKTYPGTALFMDRKAREITGRALEWLAGAKSPFFLWLHYFDPHKPYSPPAEYEGISSEPYDGEVAYVDAEIRRILGEISRKGLAGETFIILTSDHGESLGEHGELTHSIFLYRATTWVPLIMSFPGKIPPGARDSSMVELVDIVPSVVALLGLEPPPGCEGRNLFETDPAGRRKLYAYAETWAPRLQYGWSEIRSLRDGRHLYVQAPTQELYDLLSDPAELTNVIGEKPQEARLLSALMDSIEEESGKAPALGAEMELGGDERERLESLGYVFRSTHAGAEGKDPKDMIGIHRRILEARKLQLDGDYAGSLSILEEVRAADQGDPAVHLFLGAAQEGLGMDSLALSSYTRSIQLDPLEERSYYAASALLAKRGRHAEAAGMLEDLVAHYLHDATARLSLAKALARSGETERAVAAYREAADIDRNDYRIYVDFGRFLAVRGRFDEALEVLGRARELNPDSPEALSLTGACLARKGDLEEARRNFLGALAQDSTLKEVWVDLGNIEMKLGAPEQARIAARKALALDPGYAPARELLGKGDPPGGGE